MIIWVIFSPAWMQSLPALFCGVGVIADRDVAGRHRHSDLPLNIHPAAIRALAVYGPRPIATGRLEQDRWSQLLTYIRLPDAAGQRLRREPRWIFARSTSSARDIGRSQAGPHTRFGKRRNDHFTISYHFAAIAGVRPPSVVPSFAASPLLSPTARARRMCCPRAWPTRSSHSCWRARQPRHWDAAFAAAYRARGFGAPACRLLYRA